jgi:hypothetical protein
MEFGPSQMRDLIDALPPHHTQLEIVATRDWADQPEQWTADIAVDGRTISLGTFPTVGKALITGIRAYYDTKVPKHLRRKRQQLLE